MLQNLDESLEAFLRATVPLDPSEIAVAFDRPDKQWAAGISQPTVNVFLWDVHRDSHAARAGMETVDVNGTTVRRHPLPRVQVRYALTVWATSHRDEHQLLGEITRAVLATAELGPPHLQAPLDQLVPLPTLRLANIEDRSVAEFWKAVEGQFKPALELVVTMPVDTGAGIPTAPVPEVVEARTTDQRRPQRTSSRTRVAGTVSDPAAVGRLVRSRRGVGTVDERGRFVVPAEPGDELVLELPEERVTIVPAEGPANFE